MADDLHPGLTDGPINGSAATLRPLGRRSLFALPLALPMAAVAAQMPVPVAPGPKPVTIGYVFSIDDAWARLGLWAEASGDGWYVAGLPDWVSEIVRCHCAAPTPKELAATLGITVEQEGA